MVFDDTVDLVPILARIAAFFRDESCGQCVPCRVGTVRQEELLTRLGRGRPLGSVATEKRPPRRDRPGDARRLDLRPRPDGVERDRVGGGEARLPSGETTMTTSLPPSRRRIARSSSPSTAATVAVRRGRDAPRRLQGRRRLDADALLRREPHAGQRLPRLRGRARGRARRSSPACSRKAEAGMVVQTDSERVRLSPQAGPRAARLVGRRLHRARAAAATSSATAPTPRASARAPRPPRPASATPPTPGHHHAADGDARRDGRAAGQGRQRPLRARLREVHPLLQVRRGLRRRRAEHLRHRRRRTRLRRAHLDRARRAPARLGVRLLRQLHRRLPHRRADVQERARHARRRHLGRSRGRPRPTRSARTAASAARSRSTCRTTRIVKVTSPLDVERDHTATSASRAASASRS